MKVVYVTKLPPSRSGVARYADRFALVLQRLGHVRVITSGNEAPETQQVLRIVRVVAATLRALWQNPDLIVFEISWGAVAEMYAAALSILLRRERRLIVWLTVHDVPALTGGLFRIGWLRKRGRLLRVAAFLSKHVGVRIERWVLNRADVVVCLSSVGARALQDAWALDRHVGTVHFVADVATDTSEREQIFLPGPVQLSAATEVFAALAAIPSDLPVVVGFCDADTQSALQQRASSLGLGARLRFAGFLGQDELVQTYRASLIVVHWYARSDARERMSNKAACSGPVIDAIAAGSVLITNAARGAREYLAEGSAGYDLVEAPDSLRPVLALLLTSPPAARDGRQRALEYARGTLSVSAVAQEVRSRLNELVPNAVVRDVAEGTSPF